MGALDGKIAVITGGGTGIGAFLDALVSKVPLKKPGTVHAMADAAYFLATCAYATGQVIDIDGGWTAGA